MSRRLVPRHATFGFALMELLVVITIIGILATVGYASFNEVRENARDARRIDELQTLAKIFALYEVETGRVFSCDSGIKIELNSNGQLETGVNAIVGTTCADKDLIRDWLLQYLKEIPHDPLGPGHDKYFYYYDDHGCNPQPNGRILFAAMEQEQNSNREAVCGKVNTDGSGNNGGYYNFGTGGPTDVRFPYAVRI